MRNIIRPEELFHSPLERRQAKFSKIFPSTMYEMNHLANEKVFIKEVMFWDGHTKSDGSAMYNSTHSRQYRPSAVGLCNERDIRAPGNVRTTSTQTRFAQCNTSFFKGKRQSPIVQRQYGKKNNSALLRSCLLRSSSIIIHRCPAQWSNLRYGEL
jgi:hypothetical protein